MLWVAAFRHKAAKFSRHYKTAQSQSMDMLKNFAVCYCAVFFRSFFFGEKNWIPRALRLASFWYDGLRLSAWDDVVTWSCAILFPGLCQFIGPFADRNWLTLTKVKRAVCVGCNYPSKPYGLAGCVLPTVCSSMSYEWSIRKCSDVPQARCHSNHNRQVNDAFLIAGYLEEHLGFSKENAIDLAWVEFGFAHSPLHGFECVCIDSLLRFVCCMTFCRGRGGTYRPMVFASDGTVCNVWCSFQKRTWLNANNKIDFDIGFPIASYYFPKTYLRVCVSFQLHEIARGIFLVGSLLHNVGYICTRYMLCPLALLDQIYGFQLHAVIWPNWFGQPFASVWHNMSKCRHFFDCWLILTWYDMMLLVLLMRLRCCWSWFGRE